MTGLVCIGAGAAGAEGTGAGAGDAFGDAGAAGGVLLHAASNTTLIAKSGQVRSGFKVGLRKRCDQSRLRSKKLCI